MKSRLSKLLVALLLVVAIASTSLFFASCGKKGDDSTGGGASIEKPTDSTPGSTPDEPEKPVDPPVDQVTVVDRTAYTMDKIVNGYLSMPLYDVATGNFATTPEILNGYTLGDVINQALLVAEEALKEQLMGISLSAFGYYYCTDGNWYDNATKKPVNDLLNKILSYKLDGSQPLDVNLKVYGSKTLAYIMFDYVEPDLSSGNVTFDKNTIVYSLMQSSPILDAALNMNMSQLSTLLDGDMVQKIFTVVEVFGKLKVSDVADLAGIDTTAMAQANELIATLLDVSVADVCGVLVAQDPAVQVQKLAKLLGDTTVSDYLELTAPEMLYIECFQPLYETKLQDMVLAEASGTTAQLVLSKIGTVTLGEIAVMFGEIPAGYEAIFALTINDLAAAATTEEGLMKVANLLYSYVQEYTGMTLEQVIALVQKHVIADVETGEILGYDYEGLVAELYTIYKAVIDQTTTQYTGMTSEQIMALVQKYVKFDAETGEVLGYDAEGLLTELYTTYKTQIDQLAVQYTGMTSEQIMALAQKYVMVDGETGEMLGYDMEGLLNELYTTYKTQIDQLAVQYTGMTSEQIMALVGKYMIADPETGAVVGYNYEGLLNEVYATYKTQIDQFVLAQTGMTVEQILAMVGEYMIIDPETGAAMGWDYEKITAEVNAMLAYYGCPLTVQEIKALVERYTATTEDGQVVVNYENLVTDINAMLKAKGYEITVEQIKAMVESYLILDEATGQMVLNREKLMTDLNAWLYQNAGGLDVNTIISRFESHKIYDEDGNLIGYDVAGLAMDVAGVIVYLNADMPIAHFTLGDLATVVMAYVAGDMEAFTANLKIVCGDLTVGDVVEYVVMMIGQMDFGAGMPGGSGSETVVIPTV